MTGAGGPPGDPHPDFIPAPDSASSSRTVHGARPEVRVHAEAPPLDRPEIFPGKVRLWHFIVIPMLGMGVVLLLGRLGEGLLPPDLDPSTRDLYQIARTVVYGTVCVFGIWH